MTSPGSFGAVVVDTSHPDASVEHNDFFGRLLTPSTARDVDDRRQQLILHLLQKVCDSIDPTPRLFLENVRKLYETGLLTNVTFLSEMTQDPSLAYSLAQLKHPNNNSFGVGGGDIRRPLERKVGFEPLSKSEELKKQKTQDDLHSLTKLITPTTHTNMFENLFPSHEHHPVAKTVKKHSLSGRKSPPQILRELDVSRSRTDFGVFAKVGKGGFGKVYKAQHNMDGRVYAIKKIVFWHGGDAALLERKVLREVKCLAKLDSAYVCRYYGAWFEAVWNQDGAGDEFEDDSTNSESSKGIHEAFSTTDGSRQSLLPELEDEDSLTNSPTSSSITSSRASSPCGGGSSFNFSSSHKRSDSFLDMDGLLFGENEAEENSRGHSTSRARSGSRFDSGGGGGLWTGTSIASFECKFCYAVPCSCRSTSRVKSSGGGVSTLQDSNFRSSCLSSDEKDKRKAWSVPQTHRSLKTSRENGGAGGGQSDASKQPQQLQQPPSPPFLESVRSTPMKIKRPLAPRSPELDDLMMSPGTKIILNDERFSPLNSTRRLPPPSVRTSSDLTKAHQKRQDDAWRQIIDRVRFKICLYIQAQFCEGETLRHWMIERKHVEAPKCMRLFHQMVTGMHHVHLAGVIHRDLKPSNIFLTTQHGETVIKIGDFGLAKEEFQQSSSANKPRKPLGTLTYAAPEQIQGSYCDKADIYSLGIILFELYNVFETGMERAKQMSLVRKNRIPYEFEQMYPEETRLIRWMTIHNPKQRPSSTDLLLDPYIKLWDSPLVQLTRTTSLPSPLKAPLDDPSYHHPSFSSIGGSPSSCSFSPSVLTSLERSQSEGARSTHASPILFSQTSPAMPPILSRSIESLSVLQILRSQVHKSSSSPSLSPELPPESPSIPHCTPQNRARAHSDDDMRLGAVRAQEANEFNRMSRKELLLALQSQANTVREQQGQIAFLYSHIAELQKLHHNCSAISDQAINC